jgi:hypothetical protein
MPLYDKTSSFLEFSLHTQSLLFLVEKNNFHQPFTALIGYSLGEATVETAARVQIPVAQLRNGQVVTFLKTVRGEFVREYTFEVGFPPGNWIRSPIGRLIRNLSTCTSNFYLVQLCPEEACQEFFIFLPEATMSALTPGQLITVEEDAVPITATSNLQITEPRIGVHVEANVVQILAEPNALYAVDFCDPTCDDCGAVCQDGVYAGNDGGGPSAAILEVTDNQFGSAIAGTTVPTLGAGMFITSVLCLGSFIVGTYSDDPDPQGVLSDGGVFISIASGVTWTVTNLSTAMFDVAEVFGGQYAYVAVGDGGAIYGSIDGVTWTQIVQTATTGVLASIIFDAGTGIAYIAGDDAGGIVAITLQGETVTDISAALNSVDAMLVVGVLGRDHIVFGSEAGDIDESVAATSGVWTAVPTPTTNPLRVLMGDRSRLYAGGDDGIYERSPLTQRNVAAVTFVAGASLSGAVQDGAVCLEDSQVFPGVNEAVFVTDVGEIVVLKPCAPDYNA